MKSAYIKPMLYAETYTLAEHISQGCAYVTNFGNSCPISEAGVIFFTNAKDSGCNDDAFILMRGANIDPASATIDQLKGMNIQCYNSFADFNQLFTSA